MLEGTGWPGERVRRAGGLCAELCPQVHSSKSCVRVASLKLAQAGALDRSHVPKKPSVANGV